MLHIVFFASHLLSSLLDSVVLLIQQLFIYRNCSTNVFNTEKQVNEILNVATLGGTTNSSLATYAYTNVVADDTAAAAASTLVWSPGPGGSLAIASTANFLIANGATATPMALLADVDLLRVAMLNAIQALSTKLDEIVDKATLSC